MTYTSITSVDFVNQGFIGFLHWLNEVTLGIFPIMLMLTIYIISLIVSYKSNDDFVGGMAVGGFAIFVIGLFFWLGDFLSPVWFGVCIAVMILGVTALIFDK